MKKIKSEKKLCLICMEEHEVDILEREDTEIIKDREVSFRAIYEYCSLSDEMLETEEMIKKNNLAMKDAYREVVGLLTSEDILSIREKYSVSQKDFSEILDWGRATITRYENHQVQDRAHDDVLRKIDDDPKWFLEMLERAKGRISEKAYLKYYQKGNHQYKIHRNQYLFDAIEAAYAEYSDITITGNRRLNLIKVIEMINYLALKVKSLHKVKLMKMLWYSDYLHFKRNGTSISGLVYNALPNGAVPEGYEEIILLDGVKFEEVWYGENIAYRFYAVHGFMVKCLEASEIEALNVVIDQFGTMNTEKIVEKMHMEDAYKFTEPYNIISYKHAEKLTLS